MARLIDIDALVAEIEKMRDKAYPQSDWNRGYTTSCEKILSLIDTLEVKGVGLEKELNNFIEEQNAWVKDDRVVEYDNGDTFNHIYDLESIAKHFFELGLQVNNPITAADRGMAEEIIINLKRLEKDYRIDLTKEMEWLRNKVKKGE